MLQGPKGNVSKYLLLFFYVGKKQGGLKKNTSNREIADTPWAEEMLNQISNVGALSADSTVITVVVLSLSEEKKGEIEILLLL